MHSNTNSRTVEWFDDETFLAESNKMKFDDVSKIIIYISAWIANIQISDYFWVTIENKPLPSTVHQKNQKNFTRNTIPSPSSLEISDRNEPDAPDFWTEKEKEEKTFEQRRDIIYESCVRVYTYIDVTAFTAAESYLRWAKSHPGDPSSRARSALGMCVCTCAVQAARVNLPPPTARAREPKPAVCKCIAGIFTPERCTPFPAKHSLASFGIFIISPPPPLPFRPPFPLHPSTNTWRARSHRATVILHRAERALVISRVFFFFFFSFFLSSPASTRFLFCFLKKRAAIQRSSGTSQRNEVRREREIVATSSRKYEKILQRAREWNRTWGLWIRWNLIKLNCFTIETDCY